MWPADHTHPDPEAALIAAMPWYSHRPGYVPYVTPWHYEPAPGPDWQDAQAVCDVCGHVDGEHVGVKLDHETQQSYMVVRAPRLTDGQ